MLFIEKGYVYTNYLYETTVVLDRMSHFVVRQWETARRRIIANRPKQKQQYNKQHRPHDFFFLIWDLVMVHRLIKRKGKCIKFKPRFIGPLQVSKRLSPTTGHASFGHVWIFIYWRPCNQYWRWPMKMRGTLKRRRDGDKLWYATRQIIYSEMTPQVGVGHLMLNALSIN